LRPFTASSRDNQSALGRSRRSASEQSLRVATQHVWAASEETLTARRGKIEARVRSTRRSDAVRRRRSTSRPVEVSRRSSDPRGLPEFSPRREAHSASLIGVGGDLHGRNVASALMRSRLHNRTRDRGGEPIRINGGGHCPRSFLDGRGALSQRAQMRGRAPTTLPALRADSRE
jgi:hypothetical protein